MVDCVNFGNVNFDRFVLDKWRDDNLKKLSFP